MELIELTKDEFDHFSLNHPLHTFFQTTNMMDVRKNSGWENYLIGLKDNGKLVAATYLSAEKLFLNKKRFYAPRGYLIDFNNEKLVNIFTSKIKDYVKKHNGIFLKIDPYIIYHERDIEGNIVTSGIDNTSIYKSLIKLGYNHHGFTKYFDKTTQLRWMVRLSLDKTIDEIESNYAKSTRKNIEIAKQKGVEVRLGNIDNIKEVYDMLEETANRRHFKNRNINYYEDLYKYFKDNMVIYLSIINPNTYYNNMVKIISDEEQKNKEIIDKMHREKVGQKLTSDKKISDNLLIKYNKELEYAKSMKNEILIGCLIAIKSGNEYIALSSGTDSEYKDFKPKYALYERYIRDAKESNFKFANFYGITGDFDPNSVDYGIYEFKKGYRGNVIELIGEFDLIVDSLYFMSYKMLSKVKGMVRKILKK
jgi:lipid II:glycine glycyltransferase (peptidoglycan interpeptide bridge formation enzyme)